MGKQTKTTALILLLLTLLAIISSPLLAQKDDTLYFLNHDRISGEIKQFKYGHLTYKTYGVSTVNVKLDKISTFFSKKSFDILLENGSRRFGSFDTSNLEQFVKIITTNDTLLTPLVEVVEITPIKKRFLGRLSGSTDLGFSYTKANTLSQLTFNSSVKYTQRNYYTILGLNSINSVQDNPERIQTKKNDLTLTYYNRIKNSWFGIGSASAEQNSQLGLNLRTQIGLGAGNELIHTNSNNLLAYAGVVANREWSIDTTATRNNIDLVGAMMYRLFRFNKPEIEINSNAAVFPSINIANRWRFNYDIKLKIKIISDMFFSLSFYTSYDSKPPSTTSDNIDYSFSTSFGYTF